MNEGERQVCWEAIRDVYGPRAFRAATAACVEFGQRPARYILPACVDIGEALILWGLPVTFEGDEVAAVMPDGTRVDG